MRRLRSIILSAYEPSNDNVAWVKPLEGDKLDLRIFNDGKWISITNLGIEELVSSKESAENKVTTLTEESTDTEYPSAKAVYDLIQSNEKTIAAALNDLNDRLKALEP